MKDAASKLMLRSFFCFKTNASTLKDVLCEMRVPLKLEANRGAGYTRVENMARVQVDVEGGVRKHTERFRLDKTND